MISRICPGRFLAQSTLFLSIATILSVFNIKNALDKDENVIEVKPEYVSALQNSVQVQNTASVY
ncbi:cytochrome p450 [Moniliophthora roreri]|nr:cytochrome p450 [Moniliophthora roreri]